MHPDSTNLNQIHLKQKKIIVGWLLTGCFLIFIMVLVGGVTRLTGSGLSITEWNVIMGSIPPLNEQQWLEAFEKYQESPQYQKVNYHFTLAEFKNIFWWEYIHRLLGRIIGVVFLIPFIYFLLKKWLPKPLVPKLIIIFLLGGLQGFIGWFMVMSGLVENPAVSHYRLALHLVTAFITFGYTLWVALDLIFPPEQNRKRKILAPVVFGMLVLVQIIYGAFVAGLKAGFIYTTFPLMEGYLFPPGMMAMPSFLSNLTENLTTVQFIHRMLGWLIFIAITVYWFNSRRHGRLNSSINFAFFATCFQFLLGVLTILNFYKNPVAWGVLHQSGALFLFTAMVIWLHSASGADRQIETSVARKAEELTI